MNTEQLSSSINDSSTLNNTNNQNMVCDYDTNTYNINGDACAWDNNIFPNVSSNLTIDHITLPSVIERPSSTSTPSSTTKSRSINYSYYNKNSTLETRYNSKLNKYYLNIEDIFSYITLGKSFANEYYDLINNYVCNMVYKCDVKSLPVDNKIIKSEYSFNGALYDKTIVMYNLGEYSIVSYALLDWAVHNPEKIA